MAKKTETNQDSSKAKLKVAESEPKKLKLEEVREIEKFHLKRDLIKSSLEKIELERGIAKLKFENARLETENKSRSLNEQESHLKARLESDKRAYQVLVEQLKASYSVKELAYDPDTLELKGDQENG